jgi:regulator of protease activity HflC (stomatin/prohibitin superfamily)
MLNAQLRRVRNIVILFVLIILVFNCVTVIKPGYVGVVELFGSVFEKPLRNGIHFVIPFSKIHKMDTRLQAYTMSIAPKEGMRMGDDAIDALTKEGLMVRLDLTAWFLLDPSEAPRVYREIGADYAEKIVRPTLRTAIRDVVVRFTAESIYGSARDSVVSEITERTKKLSANKGVFIDKILMRNVILPTMVQDAINTKLAADQEAQKMQFVVQKERMEKERRIIEAEGIKTANEIISQGLTSNYIRWYRIEVLKQLVNSPNNTIIVLPEDMKNVPLIMGKD